MRIYYTYENGEEIKSVPIEAEIRKETYTSFDDEETIVKLLCFKLPDEFFETQIEYEPFVKEGIILNGITGTILSLSAKEGKELKIKELEKQLKEMELGVQKIKDIIAKSRE